MIRRWWPAPDGWAVATDNFAPAEPGATMELEWKADADGKHLIAVEATPETEFRVILSPLD